MGAQNGNPHPRIRFITNANIRQSPGDILPFEISKREGRLKPDAQIVVFCEGDHLLFEAGKFRAIEAKPMRSNFRSLI